MNDSHKVRVWNKSGGYYLPGFYLTPAGEVCYFGVFNGEGRVRKFDDQENYIKERCTGLRDKNGKLIYEGDVISRNNGRWKEIRFYQGGFGWWTEYDCFVSFSGHNHLEEILQTHEIIGNIHEVKE